MDLDFITWPVMWIAALGSIPVALHGLRFVKKGFVGKEDPWARGIAFALGALALVAVGYGFHVADRASPKGPAPMIQYLLMVLIGGCVIALRYSIKLRSAHRFLLAMAGVAVFGFAFLQVPGAFDDNSSEARHRTSAPSHGPQRPQPTVAAPEEREPQAPTADSGPSRPASPIAREPTQQDEKSFVEVASLWVGLVGTLVTIVGGVYVILDMRHKHQERRHASKRQ
ncbi:hypothetical protein ABZY19_29205 [Streptomyces sp. NPDC006475]|uniref:hypothetical protein n=1 Tax=Streptomyces sp. NPDC006475 TaxID=3155719 RepID=UPI0033A4AFFA